MTDFKYIEKYIDSILTVGNDSDETQLTTVLPDNSLIFGFQFGEAVYENFNGNRRLMKGAGVCGQLTRKKEYLNTPNSKTVLVKFKPWTAKLFFDDIPNLSDNNTDLSDLTTKQKFQISIDDFYQNSDKHQAAKSFLCRQFKFTDIDPTVKRAISIISKIGGRIRVDSLAYEVGNSKRNLERKFKDTTGLTLKKFIDNNRFQVSLKRLSNNRDLQEVAFLSGYYDLSHFINDFKKVTGKTPGEYCF